MGWKNMKTGWQIKTLGEVCDILDSKRKPVTKKDRISGDYPYYGATGIVDYVADYIFDERLVLVGEDGAKWQSGEKTAFIVDGQYWVNNHAHVLRPHDNVILHEWIEYYFFIKDLSEYITGVTVPKLNQAKLRSIEIPVPPLSEQKRIVKILDEKFEAIEKLKKVTKEQLADAKELFESQASRLFLNEDWEERSFADDSVFKIVDGDRGKNYPQKKDFHKEGYCLFMSTKNVRKDGFDFSENVFISKEKDKALRKGKLNRNDVVMTTRGTIGNIGVYDEAVTFDNIRINSGMLIFRPNTDVILPKFLFELLRSPSVVRQIKTHTSGAAQPQLPITTLKRFTFRLPPLAKQKQIFQELEYIIKQTQQLGGVLEKKQVDLEDLTKSYLEQAFAGKL